MFDVLLVILPFTDKFPWIWGVLKDVNERLQHLFIDGLLGESDDQRVRTFDLNLLQSHQNFTEKVCTDISSQSLIFTDSTPLDMGCVEGC